MWEELKNELKNSKIYIYSVSITAAILSVFGLVIFLASMGSTSPGDLPKQTPAGLAAVLGAQAKNQPPQNPEVAVEPPTAFGPVLPTVEPSPLPSPKISPSPSASPIPSLTPSSSPSPTPSASSSITDTSGPVIAEIKSTGIESKKVTVEWKTNEDSDSKVEYGKETSYGSSKDSSDKKTSHWLEIADLEPNSTYHYRVTSKDNAGNSTTSGDNTFTTLP